MKRIENIWNKSASTDFNLFWTYSLFGILSTIPRRCVNSTRNIYFFNKSVKNLKSTLLNEKIRQIILWKKEVQKKKEKCFNIQIPFYSIEELLLEKFPYFTGALLEFIKFFPLFFFVFHRNSPNYQKNKFSSQILSFIIRFQFFLTNYVKLKGILIIKNVLKLTLEIRGKKIEVLLPHKKNYHKNCEKKKVSKILIDFQVELALNVLFKIFSFQKHKILSKFFYYVNKTSEIWFNNPVRYYIINRISNFKNYTKSLKRLHITTFFFYRFQDSKKESYRLWNFSKNLVRNTFKNHFQGQFFYISFDVLNFNLHMITSLFLSLLCHEKNEKDLMYFFTKNLPQKSSLLSEPLFSNFIVDSVNLDINLPILPYLNSFSKINQKSNLKRFSENKKKSILRKSKNFKNFYFDLNEISFKNFHYIIFKNKTTNIIQFNINIDKKFPIYLCFMI
jgi:hypothetical protein